MHRSLVPTISLLCLCWSTDVARAQETFALRRSSPRPVEAPLRRAGTYDLRTGRWTPPDDSHAPAPLTTVYDNTCAWTGGEYWSSATDCTDLYDEGRVPASGPLGAAADSSIQVVEIAYCTSALVGTVDIDWAIFDTGQLGGACVGGVAPTPGAVPLAEFTSASIGFALPGSQVLGATSCWIVTLTLDAPFCLQSGAASTDRFNWRFRQNNTSAQLGGGAAGPLIRGEPSIPPGSGTFDVPPGIDPWSGAPCGHGLSTADSFWANFDGGPFGVPTACDPTYTAGTGCYWFGGHPANLFASFWLRLQGVTPCSAAGSTAVLGIQDQLPPDPCAMIRMPLSAPHAASFGSGRRMPPLTRPPVYAHSLPVGLFNGELRVAAVDLEVESRGFAFRFERTYSSRADFSGTLGHNWSSSLERRIALVGNDASVVNGAGREDRYAHEGGGSYASPDSLYDSLVRNGDGTWTQREVGGTRCDFDAQGYLIGIRDRAGNQMTLTRNAHHHVETIRDTQDRVYTVAYTDATPSQRIASVTDFAGRQVVYSYDGNGDLISVRSPVVGGTPNGNDYPQGKTTLYTYTSGHADARLDHNLTSIVEPAYNVANVPALSKACATITYAATVDPTAADFDRVIAERWGHDQGGPPNDPDVVVGGTSTFAYASALGGDPDAPSGAARRTIETDRNGNVRVHYFDADGHAVKTIERTNRDVRPGEGDYATLYAYDADGRLTSVVHPRGNETIYAYDASHPSRSSQGNLLEVRRRANGVGGGGADLVTRLTYEPVFNQVRTVTDARAFPGGVVPLDGAGDLDLGDSQVARYTTWNYFDYQETTGVQASQGVPANERIPEGLGDLNGAADFDEGNVVRVVQPTIQTPGPNQGDVGIATRTWNDRAQVLAETDATGSVRRHVYYASNGVPGDASDREGLLQSVTEDFGSPPRLNLTTSYEYDVVGNAIRVVDPKGQATLATFNALDQAVRIESRPVVGSVRYVTERFYDANDNLTRVERSNVDENGVAYAHAELVDLFEYDILRQLVAEVRDKTRNDGSSAGSVRSEFLYDAHGNLIAARSPLAVAGARPNHVVTSRYDERNLLYKTIRGDDDLDPYDAPPADAAVETSNYDANENPIERIDSIRHAQSASAPSTAFPGSAAGDVTRWTYDGFDRRASEVDAEGGVRAWSRDAAGNTLQETLSGPRDHQAGAPIVVLEQRATVYDELDRIVSNDRRHVAIATGADVGDGHAVTTVEYDLEGKAIEITDDRGKRKTTVWDGADRIVLVIDHLGNETELAYDANSNCSSLIERDVSTNLGSAPDVYVTSMTYDGVDRRVKTIDASGDVQEFSFDSRDNLVATSDGVRGLAHPTGPGNVVRYEHDGLNRLVRVERRITDNGRGDGALAATATTLQTFDDASRLVSQTDDASRTTSYVWDDQDRVTAVVYADGTTRTTSYDADDLAIATADAAGSVCALAYDGLGRLLSRTATRGPGVLGGTFELFGYDGASRLTFAANDDGFHAGTHECSLGYDSLDGVVREQQGALVVLSAFDGAGNRVQCAYPGKFGGGSRVLDLVHDDLDRVATISDAGGAIATFDYKGDDRVERRTYANGSKLTYDYDAGARVVRMRHADASDALLAEFVYGYDRADNRLFEKRGHQAGEGSVHSYDSLYRSTRELRGVDLSAVVAGQEIAPEGFASLDRTQVAYDGVGNRTTRVVAKAGKLALTTYVANAVHAYVAVAAGYKPRVGQADSPPTHDANGNVTALGGREYSYDFKNRLVEVRERATQTPLARYAYDAFDRRILRETFAPASSLRFVYDRGQCIEERDGGGALARQHVWGPGTDELLEQRTASSTLYAHESADGSIAALSDASAAVVERYAYDAFGAATLELGLGVNEYRYHASRRDPETGLHHMRARHYSAELGRFLQRDPIGVWTDAINLGNGYGFVGNNGVNRRDPSGLLWGKKKEKQLEKLKGILEQIKEKAGEVKTAHKHGKQAADLLEKVAEAMESDDPTATIEVLVSGLELVKGASDLLELGVYDAVLGHYLSYLTEALKSIVKGIKKIDDVSYAKWKQIRERLERCTCGERENLLAQMEVYARNRHHGIGKNYERRYQLEKLIERLAAAGAGKYYDEKHYIYNRVFGFRTSYTGIVRVRPVFVIGEPGSGSETVIPLGQFVDREEKLE